MILLRAVLCVVLLSGVGCGFHAPPNLSPAANAAWQGTRIIRALDVIRDIAIDGNAQQPPVFSTELTRSIVNWHTSAITLVHSAPAGWEQMTQVGLTELLKRLPAADQRQLGPYIALAQVLLKELRQ